MSASRRNICRWKSGNFIQLYKKRRLPARGAFSLSKKHFPRRRDCRGEHCSPGNLTWQRISGKATHAGNEHGRTKRPYRALFRQSDWNQSFLSKTKIPYCKNSRHRFDVQNNDDCNLLYPARTFRLPLAGLPVTPPCGVTFYDGFLPAVLPFWTPKKEAKKVPATSDSAGGPA